MLAELAEFILFMSMAESKTKRKIVSSKGITGLIGATAAHTHRNPADCHRDHTLLWTLVKITSLC